MSSNAGSLLRKALDIIFGSTPIFQRLLHRPAGQQRDLESQPAARPPTPLGYGTSGSRHQQFDHSEEVDALVDAFEANTSEGPGDRRSSSNIDLDTFPEVTLAHGSGTIELDRAKVFVGPVEDPSRVVVYNDGSVQGLALLISNEMVSNTQNIINHTHKVQHHTKLLKEAESAIAAYEEVLDRACADLQDANEHEAPKVQEELDSHESMWQAACRRRDEIGADLGIFQLNLEFAKNSAHDFLKSLLENADLLDPPPETPRAKLSPCLMGSGKQSPLPSEHKTTALTAEKLQADAAEQEAGRLLDEFKEAQRDFDNMDNEYQVAKADYKECFASGEVDMSRSEFDCRYVASCRETTRRLIEAEEAYKNARAHALAIGAIASDFGEPDYAGIWGEWEPESEPVEEYRERIALHDYGFIKSWMADIPDFDDQQLPAFADADVREIRSRGSGESMDVDDWDARSIILGESRSVVADVEMYRDKIDFWRESCAQLREQMLGQVDAEMR